MKFPISREALQAFDKKVEDAEQKEAFIQRMVEGDVQSICDKVCKGMSTLSREKKFIWNELHRNNRFGKHENPQINIDYYLPRLIKKLQETFLGCDIICDPLKTYLIIDWT
jgi:hypothetical protein